MSLATAAFPLPRWMPSIRSAHAWTSNLGATPVADARIAEDQLRWHPVCLYESMDTQNPPKDADPSEMTDFEKNATQEELERVMSEPDPNRKRQEKGNQGPREQPGFGQGA